MKPPKKVLIITYYWPPGGGITVLRCLKIAKYLRSFGWEPVIYTAENAHYPSLDHSNEKDVPEGITILKQPIWEPYAWYKRLTGKAKDANVNNVFYVKDDKPGLMHRLSVWIRSNFFIPDARAAWVRPSVRFLTNYLAQHPVDALFSDGPPHTNTRIATLVSQVTGIPWLADFQDPWTQVDYYQLLSLTPWGDRKHHRMEQEAFRQAAALTIVSPNWQQEIQKIGAQNVHCIPWGFDPDDYPMPQAVSDSHLTFTHLGIMGYDRNPTQLFQLVAELAKTQPELAVAIRFQLVGQVDYSVQETYQELGLEKYFILRGSVPRDQALQFALESPVLLLLLNQQENAQGRIPGKLFEYLAVRRPILALGPPDSDVAAILEETQAGLCVAYDDREGIRQALDDLWRRKQEGTLQQPLDGPIDQYSVKHLTGKIAAILDTISTADK